MSDVDELLRQVKAVHDRKIANLQHSRKLAEKDNAVLLRRLAELEDLLGASTPDDRRQGDSVWCALCIPGMFQSYASRVTHSCANRNLCACAGPHNTASSMP
jgi:hypothetical protein